jgi:hypothetical protein
MPFSKHRRKPGGKSVRHPGRGKQGKPPPPPDTPEMLRWRRFADGYTRPFHAKHGNGSPLSYLLDVIAYKAFDPAGVGTLRPVNKAEAFREFTDFEDPGHEPEGAEPALASLQAEGMIEVNGDEIRVPARFWISATDV